MIAREAEIKALLLTRAQPTSQQDMLSSGVSVVVCRDGKIVCESIYDDMTKAQHQLGLD